MEYLINHVSAEPMTTERMITLMTFRDTVIAIYSDKEEDIEFNAHDKFLE